MTLNIPRKYARISYTLDDEDEESGDASSKEENADGDKKSTRTSTAVNADNMLTTNRTRGAAVK